MTELAARLGVYAAIDEAVTRDPSLLRAAAAVIPLYGYDLDAPRSDATRAEATRADALRSDDAPADERVERQDADIAEPRVSGGGPTTVGWHQHLEEVVPEEVEVPDLEGALGELQELGEPSPLDQARRLKTARVLVRIVPDVDPETIAATLLPLVQTAAEAPDASSEVQGGDLPSQARELVDLLQDAEQFADSTAWLELVATAEQRSMISSEVAQLAAVGCEDGIVFVTVAGEAEPVLAARIVSFVDGFDVGPRTLDEVRAALEPTNWPTCLADFWCGIREIAPGPQVVPPCRWYQEKVGDCPTVWFHPFLRFAGIDIEDIDGNVEGFEMQYDLCTTDQLVVLEAAGGGGGGPLLDAHDPRVIVDNGAINVIMRPKPGGPAGHNEIDVHTSKNIRFREPLPVGGLALVACVVGWADHTRMMMSGCLHG